MSELISPCCNEELILVASIDTRRLYKCSKCKNYTKPKQRWVKKLKILNLKYWKILIVYLNQNKKDENTIK